MIICLWAVVVVVVFVAGFTLGYTLGKLGKRELE